MPSFPSTSEKVAPAQIREPEFSSNQALLTQSREIGGVVPNTCLEDGKVAKREHKPWAHLVAGG